MAYIAYASIDIETNTVVEVVEIPYDGPWCLCKGGPSAQEQSTANAITQQQLAIQNQQFSMVDPVIQQIIANGGMTPQAEAALRASTINALPQQFNKLYGQVGQQLTARGVTGGQNAGAGEIARAFGSLGALEGGQAQQGEANIANLKQQGLYGAMGTALGISGQAGQVGSSALGSATSAANAATQAQTGFWGSLMGALASPFSLTKTI